MLYLLHQLPLDFTHVGRYSLYGFIHFTISAITKFPHTQLTRKLFTHIALLWRQALAILVFQCHPFSEKTQRHSRAPGSISTPRESAGSAKTDECTEGIVTRCRRGNTWSIPRWRNVFISLFTNVAISRCVHYKVRCRLDHSIKPSVASMGNLCPGPGLCYLNSWHSLGRHVQMRTGLKLSYRTEEKKHSPCEPLADSISHSGVVLKVKRPTPQKSVHKKGKVIVSHAAQSTHAFAQGEREA